jgi:hypothetical protein
MSLTATPIADEIAQGMFATTATYQYASRSDPDVWRLYALRLGRDTFPGGGKLMFEGSFKDAHDFLDFLEKIPMNTPGMEAIKKIQNPQPFIVRVVGPLVTVKLGNERTCLNLSFNGE